MKNTATAIVTCAAVGAVFSALQTTARAQQGQGPVKVEISKIEVILQKTPRFSLESGTTEKRDEQRTWLEVEVEFQADMRGEDEYIDELQVSYFVYFDSGSRQPKVYTANITHINIPKDETTHSVVYVSPTTLGKIFGKDAKIDEGSVWVAVEFKQNGTSVGGKANKNESKKWWTSQTIGRVDGMLLSKPETPFAFLWWDRYPQVRESR